MKRFLLAAAILTAGTCFTWCLHDWTARLRIGSAALRESWLAQTQRLARAQMHCAGLTERIRESKRLHGTNNQPAEKLELAKLIVANHPAQWMPEQRERLLDELGFDWNSTGDYLVVSKESLRKVSLVNATRTNRLADTLCSVLAISADERAAVEGLMEGLATDYGAWTGSHFQRSAPKGDILAQYTLPPAPDLAKSLSDRFSAGVLATLGSERGEFLLSYAFPWMSSLRMQGDAPTVLTIRRGPVGQDWMPFELKTAEGGTMSGGLGPWQPFPGSFLPLFPGGWPELAEREGFELPKSFGKTHPAP